ncbi:uncharacterized protein LOC132557081 [Ylistrum balloti]|uniref:uncharacterized protein LOC132557081 n=1 Tax=Ylistrum balloti TaxID=509963 RepID=UPI002905B558|nr:uncharacterized protein LOC132557081 [Ylistrum balloti]
MASNTVTCLPEQSGLVRHDSIVLDLAFAMDCTASMSSYITTARRNIQKIVEGIVSSEKSDVKLALVEYRDHPPQELTYVTRAHDFTTSVSGMRRWLEGCNAQGGGDIPEAVADALHEVLKLTWREHSTKICVLISDAPPHGLHPTGDTFPNGCPAGLDPLAIVRQIAEKGITLYCVGCEPAVIPYKEFFTALAFLTGGQYVPLVGAKALTQIIIGGAQEEVSLERWMAEVDQVVQQESKHGRKVDEETISKKIAAKLKSKGARSKALMRNNVALKEASDFSKALSKCKSLKQLKGRFKLASIPSSAVSKRTTSYKRKKKGRLAKEDIIVKKGGPVKKGVIVKKGCPVKKGVKVKKSGPVKMAAKRKSSIPKVTDDEDVYKTVESFISHSQILRMMRKSRARSKKK